MKKKWGIIITVIVVLLLIYVLKDINFFKVYKLLGEVNLIFFALALLAYLASLLLWNIRFQICAAHLIKDNFWFLFKVLLSGIFVNAITPSQGMGGEPIRAYFLKKKYKISKTKFLGPIVADKMLHLIVFIISIIFSVLFLSLYLNIHPNLKIVFETFIALIFIVILIKAIFAWKKIKFDSDYLFKILFRYKSLRKNFKDLKSFKNYVNKKIMHFKYSLKSSIIDKNKFFWGIVLSTAIWLLVCSVSYILFLSLGTRVNFISIIVVVTIGYLIGDLAPVPGGIGLTEGTMFLLYSAMGIDPSLAAVVTLLSRVIYYFYSIPIGGLVLIYLKVTLK